MCYINVTGGEVMRDYDAGALEALSWILGTMEDEKSLESIRRQVKATRDDLLRSASIDFRHKVRIY